MDNSTNIYLDEELVEACRFYLEGVMLLPVSVIGIIGESWAFFS